MGAYTYDVRKMFAFLDPISSLSQTVFTQPQFLSFILLFGNPLRPWPTHWGRRMCMLPIYFSLKKYQMIQGKKIMDGTQFFLQSRSAQTDQRQRLFVQVGEGLSRS